MKKVLIVSGHTDLNQSFANKTILEALQQRLPEAEFDFLDREYPDFKIDVAKEQARLVASDIIVLQFPLFWYSVPSLLKKWLEDVFLHGFSHGSTGNKLHGKKLLLSFTTGAPEEMYVEGGIQGYPITAFLPPLQQTAALTGLEWAGFIYTGGLSYTARSDEAKLAQMREKAIAHAERVTAEIEKLAE